MECGGEGSGADDLNDQWWACASKLAGPTLLAEEFFEFGVEFAGVDAAVEDAAVFADEEHGGESEDTEVGGEGTVEAALLKELGPGELFLADEFHRFFGARIDADADGIETLVAVLGL